jgi:hypothetical protein
MLDYLADYSTSAGVTEDFPAGGISRHDAHGRASCCCESQLAIVPLKPVGDKS